MSCYINLPDPHLPGIWGPMRFRPETAPPLSHIAQALLQTDEGISRMEREWIASYVSYLNGCHFCHTIHGAVTCAHARQSVDMIDEIEKGPASHQLSDKMKALLVIAAQVQKGGKHVTLQAIEAAKQAGATDLEIHDTVLIAAAFCMFNRYVDGLHTWAPADRRLYAEEGKRMAMEGYLRKNKGQQMQKA